MSGWYADGLAFACTACGRCCTGAGGFVYVSPRDQKAIAAHLGYALADFRKRYLRLVGSLMCLVDKPNGDCVFLTEDKSCSIHAVKPRQCLTYPFWPRILASRAAWREEAERCPGMGTGRPFRPEQVDALQDRETPRELIERLMRPDRNSRNDRRDPDGRDGGPA